METSKKQNEIDISGGYLLLKTNWNSPFFEMLKVVSETPKALQLKTERRKIIWLPKSALQYVSNDQYTFKMWFRKADNGRAIDKVWHQIFG